VTSIGNKRALILRNHGLLAHGPTIPDAFNTLYRLQRACEVQAATSVIDEGLTIPEEICNDCVPQHGRLPIVDGTRALRRDGPPDR